MVAFLGCGVVGAEADGGTDAGVAISGNLDYDHPANRSGPTITRRHYNDGLRHRAAELASDFNFSPTRGEIALAFAAVSRMDAALCSARAGRRDASSPRSTGNESAPPATAYRRSASIAKQKRPAIHPGGAFLGGGRNRRLEILPF